VERESELMPRRWKPPEKERTDAEEIGRKKEPAEKLADAVQYGTEKTLLPR
jgi:hypothetical protein